MKTGHEKIFKEIAKQTKRIEAIGNPLLPETSKLRINAVIELELTGRNATKNQMLQTAKKCLGNMPWRHTGTVVFAKGNKVRSMVNVKLIKLHLCN